jgi:hypothetical protein
MSKLTIPKERIRPIKTVGSSISFFATSERDIKIEKKLVFEILRNYAIGPDSENVHRIKLRGSSLHRLRRDNISESTFKMIDDSVRGFVVEIYLDDAGLALIS